MIELIRPLEIYMLKEVCKFYKKMESTHGTPPATRLASNAAQPLKIIYHSKQVLSNESKLWLDLAAVTTYNCFAT